MSVLFGASKIYADFENVIAYADYFVCKKIYEQLHDKDIVKNHPIHGFFEVISSTGIDAIPTFVMQKKTHNPLRELADMSKISVKNGESKESQADIICDDLYDTVLSTDYEDGTQFLYTNLAHSIKILLRDTKLTDVYIYVKNMSIPIHKSIYEFFEDSNKIHVLTGDRRNFFQDISCDVYVFNNIMDVELLPPNIGEESYKRPKKDILFLNTEPNTLLWDTYFADEPNVHNSVNMKYHAEFSVLKREIPS